MIICSSMWVAPDLPLSVTVAPSSSHYGVGHDAMPHASLYLYANGVSLPPHSLAGLCICSADQ
jgi:hypothetical protein